MAGRVSPWDSSADYNDSDGGDTIGFGKLSSLAKLEEEDDPDVMAEAPSRAYTVDSTQQRVPVVFQTWDIINRMHVPKDGRDSSEDPFQDDENEILQKLQKDRRISRRNSAESVNLGLGHSKSPKPPTNSHAILSLQQVKRMKSQRITESNPKVLNASFEDLPKGMTRRPSIQLDQAQVAAIMSRNAWMLDPCGTTRRAWDTFQVCSFITALTFPFSGLSPQLVVLLYVSIIVPLRVGYQALVGDSSILDTVEVSIDAVFMVDIVLSFRTSYYDGDDKLVSCWKRVGAKYLKGWFLIDIISCFPAPLFFSHGSTEFQYARLLKALRVARLLIVGKAQKRANLLHQRPGEAWMNPQLKTSLKLLTGVLMVTHVISCFWAWTGHLLYFNYTWLDVAKVRDGTLGEQYVASFYFVVTTLATVGYGDIYAVTVAERIVCCVIMLFGSGVFGLVMALMGQVLHRLNYDSVETTDKLDRLDAYATAHRLPKQLKHRLLHYYRNLYAMHTAFNEEELFERLPCGLRQELAVAILDESLLAQPMLHKLNPEVLARLALEMKPIRISKGDVIIDAGEPGFEMYFLISGNLEVLSPDSKVLYRLLHGSCIGETEVLHDGPANRLVTARAADDCLLYAVTKTGLKRAVVGFESEWDVLTLGARVMYGLWMSDMNGSKESTAAVEQRIRKNAVRAAAAVTAVSAPPPAVPLAPTVTGTLPPGPVTRRKSLSNSNAWEGGGAMEATSSGETAQTNQTEATQRSPAEEAFAAYEAKVLGELRNFRQQLGLCGTPGPAPIGSLAPIASGVTLVETVDASTAGPAATVMPEPPHRRRSSIKGNAPAAATRANSTSGATTVVSFPQLRPSKASAPISTLRSEYTDFLKRLYTKKYGGALPLSRDPSTKVFTTFSRSTLQPGVSRGMSTAMSRGFSSAKPPEMSETPSGAADNRD